jgi:predicted nucleotidyltransferase
MSVFDPRPFVEAIQRRNEETRAALASRRDRAIQEARSLAGRIKREVPGVEEVILFGSVAEDRVVGPDFDIDLAIVGGDPYLAEDIATGGEFRVDIADFTRLPEHLRKRISERGIKLA